MLTRRSLLKSVPVLLAAFGRATPARATTSVRAATARRYFVQIALGGGIDSMWFTDPKERSEVDPDVDVPYAPDAILNEKKARYGPLFAPLAKWASRTTIVNGVVTGSANHPAALRQLLRLRTGATDEMPLALELIGSRREGPGLGCVGISVAGGSSPMESNISRPVLDAIDEASPDDMLMMARVMRKREKSLEGIGDRTTKASVESCAQFFEAVATAPRFVPAADWGGAGGNPFARDLQRALWLLKNDLTRCVVLSADNWDTHVQNSARQKSTTDRHFPLIAKFLAALETTSNRHGSLFDNTVVTMASELGRFPVLNTDKGKDHFPEVPFIFVNAEGGGEVFGRTGRRMQALPMPKRRNGNVTVTDIGATLLRMGGVDPSTCGYGTGEPLEFLGA